MDGFSTSDLKTFRKRMVGVILATDMAKHMEDLDTMKRKIEQLGIDRNMNNGSLFINKTSGNDQFDS